MLLVPLYLAITKPCRLLLSHNLPFRRGAKIGCCWRLLGFCLAGGKPLGTDNMKAKSRQYDGGAAHHDY